MDVPKELLVRLQAHQERVRNVCVLAHVDHGKTTLSDNLIASNGIISAKLVGEMRYLDSRDDEQQRGITMKSSSISLLHVPGAHRQPGGVAGVPLQQQIDSATLINLIDSPGHVDFCSEVSTAVRLCDGAFIVVDAVEGVCIQTHAVLRQAYAERVTPCLVINKVDRLVTELELDPAAAYERLQKILDDANSILSALASVDFLKQADEFHENADEELEWYEGDEAAEADVFVPSAGNVMLCSAVDGWGFTIPQFATLYAEKFGFSVGALSKALWGPYVFQAKTKSIVHASRAGPKGRAMLVQFVLAPLWSAYEAAQPWADGAAILGKIVKSQGLSVPEKAIEAAGKPGLQAVMRAWLPLAEAALSMAESHMPSPPTAAPIRAPHLTAAAATFALDDDLLDALPPTVRTQLRQTQAAIAASSAAADAPVVAFITKMVAVPAGALPYAPGARPPADPEAEVFLGFGRVFSGILRDGQRLHVLSALYTAALPEAQRQTAKVDGLYLMMGRAFERLAAVPAGSVFAIGGLQDTVLKSATLASSPAAFPLAPLEYQATPIVQVAVEPALPHQLPLLERGLQLLNRADAFVEVTLSEDTGEWRIGAAGEVHLETVIKDLQERFARIELLVSPPLVAFRESVAHPAEVPPDSVAGVAPPNDTVVEAHAAGGLLSVRVRARPLPAVSAGALDDAVHVIDALNRSSGARNREAAVLDANVEEQLATLRERLAEGADSAKDHSMDVLKRAWMLGPKQRGPNVLAWTNPEAPSNSSLFAVPPSKVVHASKATTGHGARGAANDGHHHAHLAAHNDASDEDSDTESTYSSVKAEPSRTRVPVGSCAAAHRLRLPGALGVNGATATAEADMPAAKQAIESGIAAGFQMSTACGPLCNDALWGVAFELEVAINRADFVPSDTAAWAALDFRESVYGPLSGQVMTAVANACRSAVEQAGVRLVEAYYLVQVATSTVGLDAAASLIKQRRGRILDNEAREGQDLFLITAHIPVEACLSHSSSGAAAAADAGGGHRRGGGGGGGVGAAAGGPVASFADELRRETSGAASASLSLSHWQRLQVDPHWKPHSEEEREEHGEEGALMKNLAKSLANMVRSRKGLPLLGSKVVDDATKQRTRSKKV